ncbi:MAG: type I restriction endonuclease [Candidatus Poribacteria bacterium]|nr:type I restriction endonuclease [Candidatus Poribacteria bacterium]
MQLMIPDPLNSEKMIPVSPEEHPLNKEALEILRRLYIVNEEIDDPERQIDIEEGMEDDNLPLSTSLPILDLLRWGDDPWLLSEMGSESPSLNPTLHKLDELTWEGKEYQVMKLLAGPHGENRPVAEWWLLGDVSLKQEEEIKHELRWSLKMLLTEAQHEMNLRQHRQEWLMDWFRSLSAARQYEEKAPLSALTPEQEEILLDWMMDVVVDTIAKLRQEETLDVFDQELLDTLTATQHTVEEQHSINEFLGFCAEEYINDLQAQETFNVFDQELLDTLTAVTQETAREPIPESEIAPDAKIENTSEAAPDTNSVQEKAVHCSEDQVKDIVADYFKSLRTASPNYSVKREYLIQMGSDRRRADIVFLRNGNLVAIAECKRTGRVEKGNEQLKSYLCATDTFLGIFANDSDPSKWTFWENHRHNNFLEIDRETFENHIYNHDKAIKDRGKKIKLEIEREIDAEIRERVRKNTDTNAIRQDETDRIKREVMENIDKTAIVNSMRSQIAQQVENGLLNKRDEENRKHGRSQGFWWTILSIIGFGILIALLTSAA